MLGAEQMLQVTWGQVLRTYLGAPKAGLDAGLQLRKKEEGRLSLAREVAPQFHLLWKLFSIAAAFWIGVL